MNHFGSSRPLGKELEHNLARLIERMMLQENEAHNMPIKLEEFERGRPKNLHTRKSKAQNDLPRFIKRQIESIKNFRPAHKFCFQTGQLILAQLMTRTTSETKVLQGRSEQRQQSILQLQLFQMSNFSCD